MTAKLHTCGLCLLGVITVFSRGSLGADVLLAPDFGKFDPAAPPTGWIIQAPEAEVGVADDAKFGKVLHVLDKGANITCISFPIETSKLNGRAIIVSAMFKYPDRLKTAKTHPKKRPRLLLSLTCAANLPPLTQTAYFDSETPDWRPVTLACDAPNNVTFATLAILNDIVPADFYVAKLTVSTVDPTTPDNPNSAGNPAGGPAAIPGVPSQTLDDSGLLFNAAIVQQLLNSVGRATPNKNTVVFIGPGLPCKDWTPKADAGWTVLSAPKGFSGAVTPRKLLAEIPEWLVKEKPELIVLVGDGANRKVHGVEQYDWADLARLCLRLGAVPVLAVPAASQDEEHDPRKQMLFAASDAACPVVDLKMPSLCAKHVAQMGRLIEKFVFKREPPAQAAGATGVEEE